MSRNNKKYYKNLHDQAYEKMQSMMSQGESRRGAKVAGTASDKIFSYNTYKTYWRHIKYYIAWLNSTHPDCSTLRQARKYVPEWLQIREAENLSAWTIQTEAKALGKLFGITPDDSDYYTPPQRHREDIKRSRTDTKRDQHFSVTNNDELIKFCKGTGLRRSEIEKLIAKDLRSRDQLVDRLSALSSKKPGTCTLLEASEIQAIKDALMFDEQHYLFIRGKGGRIRYSPIIVNEQRIVERMQSVQPDNKVWKYVNSNADIHSYRAEYCYSIYSKYAREIEDIPYDVQMKTGGKRQSDVYTCRKDEAGKKLDKAALLMCSKALGHNRKEVVVGHYLRGL